MKSRKLNDSLKILNIGIEKVVVVLVIIFIWQIKEVYSQVNFY